MARLAQLTATYVAPCVLLLVRCGDNNVAGGLGAAFPVSMVLGKIRPPWLILRTCTASLGCHAIDVPQTEAQSWE